MEACQDETVQLVIAKPQLVEIGRVLHEPKIQKYLRWNDVTISSYLHDLRTFAEVVSGTTPLQVTQDPTDNMLFAAAVEADAKYLVSGDEVHVLAVGLYRGIQTVSPRVFVERVLGSA